MASYSLDPLHSAPDGLARQAAAEYLRELLLRPGRPRRTWEQYAERTRQGQVNQLAVAEVLARHLWQHPRRARGRRPAAPPAEGHGRTRAVRQAAQPGDP